MSNLTAILYGNRHSTVCGSSCFSMIDGTNPRPAFSHFHSDYDQRRGLETIGLRLGRRVSDLEQLADVKTWAVAKS